MLKNKIRGLWVFITAAFICFVINSNIRDDMFSVSLGSDDFNHRYLLEYTQDSCEPVNYVGSTTGKVEVYTLSNYALSLKANKYDLGFGYNANDNSTVLKIFSSDYTSEDNSGGKILLYENLNPDDVYLKTTIELDQDVHSVYILVETLDENFSLNSLLLESWNPVCTDRYFFMALTILCAALVFVAMNMNWAKIQPI